MTASNVRHRGALFLGASLLILATCVWIVRSPVYRANPEVMAWAVTFDLTLTIPFFYWLLIGSRSPSAALRTAGLFALCCAAAALLVPRDQQQMLRQLRAVAVPAGEILLVGVLVLRIVTMRRETGSAAGPYERILAAAQTVFGATRLARVVASEITMVYYALFCWRKQRDRSDAHAFTFHERNGWGSIVACIVVLIVAESAGVHLLIALRYPRAAWVWTALDAWAILWLMGDYHALRLRPSRIDRDGLQLRYGMRWSADVPLSNIVSVEPVKSAEQWKTKDILRVALLDEPRWMVRFRDPVIVSGLAGLSKTVTAVAMLPDDETPLTRLANAIAPAA